MTTIWEKVKARVHRGQIPLEGESYSYLTINRDIGRKIPLGTSRYAWLHKEVVSGKSIRFVLDYTKLYYESQIPVLNTLSKISELYALRIGHQRRRRKTDHKFVVYIPKWFRDKYCIPGGKDHFLPKIELTEEGIYLYPVP
jgi:hypothetical protein